MLIPESILKKRHDLDDLIRKRSAIEQPKKKATNAKAFYVKKPETFIARGRSRRNHATRFRRVAKKGMQKRASNRQQLATKELEDDDEQVVTYRSNSVGASMVFCIRIRDDFGLPKVVKNLLTSLRLTEQHQGVFLQYTEEMRKTLHLVEPYVVYGPPSKAVVADLMERRGHAMIDEERVPLSDNIVIEEALGEHNILCTEDLVHELHTVGDAFAEACSFLAPFKLVDAKSHFERKTLKVKDGKDYGDRGEAINDYIKEVL